MQPRFRHRLDHPPTHRPFAAVLALIAVTGAASGQSELRRLTNWSGPFPSGGTNASAAPVLLGSHQGKAYFAADTTAGPHVVVTDGSGAGTKVLGSLPTSGMDFVRGVVSWPEGIYFRDERHLWFIDGQDPAPRRILAVEPGRNFWDCASNDRLLIGTNSDFLGRGIFEVDRTNHSLSMLTSAGSRAYGAVSGGGIVFRTSDPQQAGLPWIVYPGRSPTPLVGLNTGPVSFVFESLTLGDRLLLRTATGLFSTDGTPSGTLQLARYASALSQPLSNRRVVFPGAGEVLATDGTIAGTHVVAGFTPMSQFVASGGRGWAYFRDTNRQLWASAGLPGDAVRVDASIAPQQTSIKVISDAQRDWLLAWGSNDHIDVFVLEGTPPRVEASGRGSGSGLRDGIATPLGAVLPLRFVTLGRGTNPGTELAVVSPTSPDIELLVDLNTDRIFTSSRQDAIGSTYGTSFCTSQALVIDRVARRAPAGSALGLAVGGGTVGLREPFAWPAPQYRDLRLVYWDIHSGAITELHEFVYAPHVSVWQPPSIGRLGSDIVFADESASSGIDLWRSDGTIAGTRRLGTLAVAGSPRGELVDAYAEVGRVVFAGVYAFEATSGSISTPSGLIGGGSRAIPFGRSVYSTGFTSSGVEVHRLDVDGSWTNLGSGRVLGASRHFLFTELGGDLYRWARRGGGVRIGPLPSIGSAELHVTDRGTALWSFALNVPGESTIVRSDGTQIGVQRAIAWVRPIPGHDSVVFGVRREFGTSGSGSGPEVWVSDGTPNGTWRWLTLDRTATVVDAEVVGGDLMLIGPNGTYENELWAAPIQGAVSGRGIVTEIAGGCPGDGGTPFLDVSALPTVGDPSFAFSLDGCPPGASIYLGISTSSRFTPIDRPCAMHIGDWNLVFTAIADARGAAAVPMPIPLGPALQGLELYVQALVDDPTGPALGGRFSVSDCLLVIPGS